MHCMRRKLLWLLGLLAIAAVTVNLVDRRRARQSRELWAEATDPV